MELNYNSVSARVYRNFYETSNMPESLCPYFWKLVAAWPVTILFFPVLFPFWIADKFTKSQDNNGRMPFPAQVLIGLIFYLLSYFLFCIGVTISSFWITYNEKSDWYPRYILGWFSIGVIVICLITYGIVEWRKRLRIREIESRYDADGNYIPLKLPEDVKPNIVVEFIKAKYNKYCPKIDWKLNKKESI
jgi:hypothetical protein